MEDRCNEWYVPWLFLLAYDIEWVGGGFHSDGCFAFFWGFLPVVAGELQRPSDPCKLELGLARRYERILKAISLGVITLEIGLLVTVLKGW